ncbi:MAG: alanine racemase, partial [Bryobacteraceae bacterium]
MSGAAYRSWVEVSLGQIAGNFEAIRALTGADVEVMPVVKADAYRHGAVEVSRTLVKAGARWLAVSSVEEGAALRDAGIQTRILVMADFLPAERAALFDYNLTPVIHSLDDVLALDAAARQRERAAVYHLKIDSGMGRLGTRAPAAEIAEVVLRCG